MDAPIPNMALDLLGKVPFRLLDSHLLSSKFIYIYIYKFKKKNFFLMLVTLKARKKFNLNTTQYIYYTNTEINNST